MLHGTPASTCVIGIDRFIRPHVRVPAAIVVWAKSGEHPLHCGQTTHHNACSCAHSTDASESSPLKPPLKPHGIFASIASAHAIIKWVRFQIRFVR